MKLARQLAIALVLNSLGQLEACAGQVDAALPPLPTSFPVAVPDQRTLGLGPLSVAGTRKVDLRMVSVSQVIDLIYSDMQNKQYVLAPEVLSDQRLVSFRFDRQSGDIREVLAAFLDSLGYRVETASAVDFVSKKQEEVKDASAKQVYVYRPRFRSADYLSRLVQPVVGGQFTSNRSVPAQSMNDRSKSDAPITSAAGMVDQSSDVMVFVGSEKEVGMLKQILPAIDVKQGEVSVRAWVFEVSTDAAKTSAFELAASVLGGRFGISIGSGTVSSDANALRLHSGFLDAAIAALDSDSRFRELTSPNLRIASGKHGRLNVGQSVPVVGSVSYPSANGAAVQSVTYEDAGVIFDVLPVVKDEVIDTDVTIEISDFVSTTTGVNNSPTKNTRKSETSMELSDGDVVVMGGMSTTKSSDIRSGVSWLPAFMDGRSLDRSGSDILLILQVKKV